MNFDQKPADPTPQDAERQRQEEIAHKYELNKKLRENPKLAGEYRLQRAGELMRGWQMADGLAIGDSIKTTFVQRADPQHPRHPMTWNRNNDTLAAVGPDGRLFVTPYTESAARQLEELNFRKDGTIGVPLSNNEMPTNTSVRSRWEEAQRKAKKEADERKEKAA